MAQSLHLLPRLVLLAAAAGFVQGDLQMDLYKAAKLSTVLTPLTAETLEDFVGVRRPAPTVVVMFHDSACHICHRALPEFERAAMLLSKTEAAAVLAHVDGKAVPEPMKQRLGMRGFPAIFAWRALSWDPKDEDPAAGLLGRVLRVDGDAAFMLRAARQAGMGTDRDAKRLQALGREGTVVDSDFLDQTVKLEVAGVGKVWFPMEALLEEAGANLPYLRSEARLAYSSGWTSDEMLHFVKQVMHPLVASVASKAELARETREELLPALVFCGDEVTRGFLEAAVAQQGKARAFHAADLACPVPVTGSGPQVVVYSPPGQQWTASGQGKQAAVTVAGADVVADDGLLLSWIASRPFPGVAAIGINNFHLFIRSTRSAILVGIRTGRTGDAMNAMVERRLLHVANPSNSDAGTNLFTYTEGSYLMGVVDGTLEGLTTFGILPYQLPHVVVFMGPEQWVEDVEELTIEGIAEDLSKIPRLWHFNHNVRGKVAWVLREIARSFRYYDELAVSVLGESGHLVVVAVPALMVAFQLYALVSAGRSVVGSLLAADAESAGSDKPKAE